LAQRIESPLRVGFVAAHTGAAPVPRGRLDGALDQPKSTLDTVAASTHADDGPGLATREDTVAIRILAPKEVVPRLGKLARSWPPAPEPNSELSGSPRTS
jgi:hypothetical protein